MNELLALLSPSAAMAFLLASASMYLILQVAREDAKYSLQLKRVLLVMAWPIFAVSTLVFLGILLLALLPVVQQYSIELPKVNIDASLFVFYGLTGVFFLLFFVISSYVFRKMERWLPKSETDKKMAEAAVKLIDSLDKSRDVVEDSRELVRRSLDLAESFNDDIEQLHEIVMLRDEVKRREKSKNFLKRRPRKKS